MKGVDASDRAKPPQLETGDSADLWAAADEPAASCRLSAGLAYGVALRAALAPRGLRDGPPAPIGISRGIAAAPSSCCRRRRREPTEYW